MADEANSQERNFFPPQEKINQVIGDLSLAGAKNFGKMIGLVILVGLINLIPIVMGAFQALFVKESPKFSWSAVGLLLLIGIIFTLLCAVKLYQHTLKTTIAKAYQEIKELVVRPACFEIVDAVMKQRLINTTLNTKEGFNKTFDVVTIIGDKISVLPTILKKPLYKVIQKIPFYGIIGDYWELFENQSVEVIGEKVYQRVDEFVLEDLLGSSLKWLLWLIPLNIIIQIGIYMNG